MSGTGGTVDPDGPATSRKTTKEAGAYLGGTVDSEQLREAMIEAGKGRPLSEFVSDGRGPKDEGGTVPFKSDVNVGGPDGDPRYCTVGTVIVHYVQDASAVDARQWLWRELDAVRHRYEAKFPTQTGRLGGDNA